MISNPERIVRNPENPSFLTTFNGLGRKEQEPINTLDDALRSEDEGPSSTPEKRTIPAPDSFSKFLNYPRLRAQIREIAHENTRRIYVHEMDMSLLNAVEDAISDAF